ncbi:hypothetical protein PAMA_000001 [Pampus argenteus]
MNHLDPDDAIFLVDAFLDECKVDQHGHTKGGSKKSTKLCVWLDEDNDGQPLPKRCRAGEKQKRDSATESLIQDVRDLLGSGAEQPLPSHWRNRQTSSLENWTVMRPFMVNNMLSSEKPKEGVCHHCGNKAAVVMCKDCLPRSLYCTACDLSTHEALLLHNRASMVEGKIQLLPSISKLLLWKNLAISDLVESGYWPATVNFETFYMMDLFTMYEDLKITATGMSRQAFVSMLECRTKLFGRSGNICGDTMQRAFLEWAYAKFGVDKLSQEQQSKMTCRGPSRGYIWASNSENFSSIVSLVRAKNNADL